MYSLLGVTVHWVSDKWKLCDLGLGLFPLSGPHSGENICEAFIDIVETRFELLHKVVL
jgi:hypothetical protein